MTQTYTLYGRIPSLKNSKQIITRRGRQFTVPSTNYTTWHRDQSMLIQPKVKIDGPVSVTMSIYFPDNLRADLDNKASSVIELLVDNGILEDDNWRVVRSLHIESCGIDKGNPRCEVVIQTLTI